MPGPEAGNPIAGPIKKEMGGSLALPARSNALVTGAGRCCHG